MRAAKKAIYCALICSFVFFAAGVSASAAPYRSYTYDHWGDPVPAPQAYLPTDVLDGAAMGVGLLKDPRDIFVDSANTIYLADTGNHRILIFDETWNLERILSEFEREGAIDRFLNPEGLHVTADGTMYVADTGNERILVFDREFDFVREIGPPAPDLEGIIPENFAFKPKRIAVDRVGRLYVVAEKVFEGILEFDVDGEFRGFIGAPRVAPNPLDVLWRMIATEQQRDRLALFLPTEFLSISVDERGFIYATVPPTSIRWEDAIRRLNPSGMDVLRRRAVHPPIGDIQFTSPWEGASITGRSVLQDIITHEYGVYSALDQRRGRVFTYDSSGYLLHVFGGPGTQAGTFQSAIALSRLGDRIVVLDNTANAVTVFEPTEYGRLIFEAIRLYETGEYGRAEEVWRQILRYNANYDLAYTGIGKAHLRRDEFREAMIHFRNGHDRQGYSDAFRLYRRQLIGDHFGLIAVLLLVGLILGYGPFRKALFSFASRAGKRGSRRSTRSEVAATALDQHQWTRWAETLAALRYSLHVIVHPFDGFWDLKHEKRGNLPAALLILAAVALTYVVMRQYTGFLFNPYDPNRLNILVELSSILLPVGLWTIVNWSLTTLMDGKGTLRDVLIATAYALTPIVVINVPATLLSNFLTLEEGAFYYFLITMSSLWAMALLYAGTMVTHEYTFLRTSLTVLAVLAGILFVLYIGLLCVSVSHILVSFVTDIYKELVFRL